MALFTSTEMQEKSTASCVMSVDTGKDLHVAVLRPDEDDEHTNHLAHLGVYHEFSELDAVNDRFKVDRSVIDGLPETHGTRDFAGRHRGTVYMSFFNEHQRGGVACYLHGQIVAVNRSETLGAILVAVRKRLVILPRRMPIVDLFAEHMAANAKILEAVEETGAK